MAGVCTIGVKRFCGAVFSGVPSSWMVKGNVAVCSLTTEECIHDDGYRSR